VEDDYLGQPTNRVAESSLVSRVSSFVAVALSTSPLWSPDTFMLQVASPLALVVTVVAPAKVMASELEPVPTGLRKTSTR
jgi:hypothetical protein